MAVQSNSRTKVEEIEGAIALFQLFGGKNFLAVLTDVTPGSIYFRLPTLKARGLDLLFGTFVESIAVKVSGELIQLGSAVVGGIESNTPDEIEFWAKPNFRISDSPLKEVLPKATAFVDIPQKFKLSSVASEQRNSQRIDIRSDEHIFARIEKAGKENLVQVYDISTAGLSIIATKDPEGFGKIGDSLRLQLRHSQMPAINLECEIRQNINLGEGRYKLGLKIIHPTNRDVNPNLLSLPSGCKLGAVIYKQLFYMESTAVELLAISVKEASFVVRSSDIVLLPSMPIEIKLFTQTARSEAIGGVVKEISRIEREKIVFKIEIIYFPESVKNDLINYFLHNTSWTPAMLRSVGLIAKDISNTFSFRFVRTHDEYLEVLRLRALAYKLAGKISDSHNIGQMVATLDHKSRILIVQHKERIVGSVAITFPDDETLTLDTERALRNGYPVGFPSKLNMIEISRLCTHPQYRQGDLLVRIFEHIYKILACSGREFLVSSTEQKLWPLYKKIGFKKTGVSYPHPSLDNLEHHLILAHLSTGTEARNLSPFVWNYFYREMSNFLEFNGIIKRSVFGASKILIYRIIGRLFKIRKSSRY